MIFQNVTRFTPYITELKKRSENLKYVKKILVHKGVWPSSMIGVRLDEGSKPDQS